MRSTSVLGRAVTGRAYITHPNGLLQSIEPKNDVDALNPRAQNDFIRESRKEEVFFIFNTSFAIDSYIREEKFS